MIKYLSMGLFYNNICLKHRKKFTASETVMPHHAINCLLQNIKWHLVTVSVCYPNIFFNSSCYNSWRVSYESSSCEFSSSSTHKVAALFKMQTTFQANSKVFRAFSIEYFEYFRRYIYIQQRIQQVAVMKQPLTKHIQTLAKIA